VYEGASSPPYSLRSLRKEAPRYRLLKRDREATFSSDDGRIRPRFSRFWCFEWGNIDTNGCGPASSGVTAANLQFGSVVRLFLNVVLLNDLFDKLGLLGV
jgi:hypothetical protein